MTIKRGSFSSRFLPYLRTHLKVIPQQLARLRAVEAKPEEAVHRASLNLCPGLPARDGRLAHPTSQSQDFCAAPLARLSKRAISSFS
jgi:hypothetical protein